jgi:hypothetical protein
MLIGIDADTHRKPHTLKFYISVYIVCILLNNRTITLYWVFSYANELLLYASVKCLTRVVLNCVYTVIYLWSITATSGNSYHLYAVFALIVVIGSDCIDSQSIRSLPRIMTTTETGGTAKTLNNVVIRISTCCADTSKKKIEDTEGPGRYSKDRQYIGK